MEELLRDIAEKRDMEALSKLYMLTKDGVFGFAFSILKNERKFEIGVKRAVGATSGEIIRQFLYESIFVMMVNIVLSVALVIDIFVVYKYIYESIPNE